MNSSQRRLILKVFVLTMLFSSILLFLYRENNIYLPQIWDHHYDDQQIPFNAGPYSEAPSASGAATGLQDQVNADLEELLNTLWLTDHNSAIVESLARKKYEDMCRVFSSLCSLVSWNWTFNRQEYYQYQWLFISLANYLDKTIAYPQKFSKTLKRISFHKDESGRRWGADHTKIRINTQIIPSSRELWEVLTHEAGHIVDFSVLAGSMPALNKTFTEFWQPAFRVDDPSFLFYGLSWKNELVKNADASYKDFVSGYAMQDPFEDIAETFDMYINHYDLFVKMTETSPILKQKFAYVQKIFGTYKGHPTLSAKTRNLDPSERLRDTTKLYTSVFN